MTDTASKPDADQPKLSQAFIRLAHQLRECSTVADLFKLANSDTFRDSAHALKDDELTALRDAYRGLQTDLQGKVRLGEFNDQIIRIVDISYWHTDQFVDESRGQTGDGVTLTFHPDNDPSKTFRALTSSVPIVRFCNAIKDQPTVDAPLRVHIKQEPVSDAKRAAAGQKIWTVKRLPMPGQATSSPF